MAETATVTKNQFEDLTVDHAFERLLAEQVYAPALLETAEPCLETPKPFLLSEMSSEKMSRQQAAHLISSVAMKETVELQTGSKIKSLKEGIHLAKAGDAVADAMVETNISTHIWEAGIKVGIILDEIELEVDHNGDIFQHGQMNESVHLNSLLYASNNPSMRARSEAEARNGYRDKQANSAGIFKDNYVVRPSLVDDRMTQEELKKANFFTDTMSTALQITTAINGPLTLVSGFSAGVARPGAERHDLQTVVAFGKRFGVDLSGLTTTEIIDTGGIVIPGHLLPNGEADIFRIWDECAAEVIGEPVFFGQAGQQRDYVTYRHECRQRLAAFKDKILLAKQELIAEADTIQTEIQAVHRLNKIAGKHLVDRVIEDTSLDPSVLGEEAAAYVMEARHYRQMGNYQQMMASRRQAYKTEKSASCPTGMEDENNPNADVYGFLPEGIEGFSGGTDKFGARKFKCSNGHTNTRPHNERIDKCQHPNCQAVVKC